MMHVLCTSHAGKFPLRSAAFGIVLSLAALAANVASAQTMEGLGFLPGAVSPYSSLVSNSSGVSSDGSMVVGTSSNDQGGFEAFVWRHATGMMVGLGYLPGAQYPYSQANGVSADGSTVVGWSYGELDAEAFIWKSTTGMVGLGVLPGASYPNSYAQAVSANGSTVVGGSYNAQGRQEAFIWTEVKGMVGLGIIPCPEEATPCDEDLSPCPVCVKDSYAMGVSADGSTVVGSSGNDQEGFEAFIWTQATGMVGLGFLPGALQSRAYGVSSDGSKVVGYCVNAQGNAQAFVWTAGTGMVGLGYLPGALTSHSIAFAVSADGSTVVGQSISDQGNVEAFVWTAATGMVGLGSLPDALAPYSVAYGVSADGSSVVGQSTSPQGDVNLGIYNYEAFVLDLTPDPADLIVALIEQVMALNLRQGIENSLDAKLNTAFDALMDAVTFNDISAVNSLDAFINAVNAQRGKAIPAADADALIAAAQKIIDLLE